jgi:hypothetical protein
MRFSFQANQPGDQEPSRRSRTSQAIKNQPGDQEPENKSLKIRGGPPTVGVEGLPEAGGPLDPGPGLGDMVSLGLLEEKSSSFLR